jgi:hypothetical protein
LSSKNGGWGGLGIPWFCPLYLDTSANAEGMPQEA